MAVKKENLCKVQKVPKILNLKSPYRTLIRASSGGYTVYKYHRTKRMADKECDKVNKLNKNRP